MSDWIGDLPGAGELPDALGGGALPGDPGVDDGGLLLDLGGETYGLSASLVEGDGSVGSVTLADDNGMTICADTDGDGAVDYLSVVGFDGSWSAWRRLGSVSGATGDAEEPTDGDPPATPGSATDNWNTDGWKCVERGGWG
jgi:hypothetical protein